MSIDFARINPSRRKEWFEVQPPPCLHVAGCLPSVDAVVAEEIFGQFSDRDPLIDRPDE